MCGVRPCFPWPHHPPICLFHLVLFSPVHYPWLRCAQGAMYAFPRVTVPERAVVEAKKARMPVDTFYCLHMVNETGVVCCGRRGADTDTPPPSIGLGCAVLTRHLLAPSLSPGSTASVWSLAAAFPKTQRKTPSGTAPPFSRSNTPLTTSWRRSRSVSESHPAWGVPACLLLHPLLNHLTPALTGLSPAVLQGARRLNFIKVHC